MRAVLRFLLVTVVHKWHVFVAGRSLHLPIWQLLIHDLSKFRPSEFIPYSRFFYSAPGATWKKACVDNSQKEGMRRAWLLHIQRNPHHWNHWCLVNGASVVTSCGAKVETNRVDALPMPDRYVREMVADWMGAARAYDGAYPKSIPEWTWWQQNRDTLILHPETREALTDTIMMWFYPSQPWTAGHDLHHVWGDGPPPLRPQAAKEAAA